MKKHTSHRVVPALLAMALAPGLAWSQATTANSPDSTDQTVILDPFTVTTEHEGYQATDTLGGARVRTKLADTPSSISVITPKYLQDLGVTNAEDLFRYTTNTEIAGLNGTFSGVASRGFGAVGAAEASRLSNPSGTNRSRGLTAMDSTRNYFITQIPGDSFNISRWEIARGPNSFLFGVGSPSGINNVTTNEANYKDGGSIEGKAGSFGTHRESIDYNKVLIPGQLAIRLDAVNDDTQYQQKPAFSHSKRIYGAVRLDPKALDTEWAKTRITANYEHGRVSSNLPRELPPLDYISGYFQGTNKAGYDPFTYNSNGPNNYDVNASPWVTNANNMHYAWGNSPTYWYDALTGNLLRASQSGMGGNGAPAGLTNIRQDGNTFHIYTAGFTQFARSQDYTYPGSFPGAYARTVNYLDKSLSDTSIFDFYNKLIDGSNKREGQKWDAFNINVVQSFLDNRLVLQAVVDHQKYNREKEGLLTSYITPFISVDMDQYMLTYPSWSSLAQTNPNVGRPFIAGDTGGGGNTSTDYTTDNYQFTAAYSLRFEDHLGKTDLAKILGHHEFTALAGRYTTQTDTRAWDSYALDTVYARAANRSDLTLSNRLVSWVAYLGPTLMNAKSASGSYLSSLTNPLVPTSGPVKAWSNVWTAASTVNPTAEWIHYIPGVEDGVTLTQAANPANYAGYTSLPGTVLNSKANRSELYTSGSKAEEVIESQAFMYQGYFWDDTIIPSVGFRKDKVRQRGNQAALFAETGVANMNYGITDSGVSIETKSTSYGITVHLPKSVKKSLPEGTDVSVFYFHGANETPKVRYGIDGTALPNESGRTNDYGVQLDGFGGRASLRLTYFKTKNKNAQASYGTPLGSAGWLIDSLPSWTLTMAASGIMASKGTPPDAGGNSWLWGWGQSNPALANRIAAAIQKEFPVLFPQSYWDQYGLPVSVAAIKAGDWANVVSNGAGPYPWSINNTHLVHGTTPMIDQNLVSKGYEMEVQLRPLKGWDITFNATKVNAYQTSLGAGADKYLNGMARLWLDTDIGLTPEWGGNAIRNEFMSGIWSPYLTQVALTGTTQPELRKWNFRGVTNYTFSSGPLNGINVGGAFRWASKPILGYGISQATLFGNSAWLSDVKKPLYGEIDMHFDAWIGYQRKLSKKLDWRVQVNLRNVGERPHLTPISVEPDGTWAQQRIVNGMTYEVSNKFMF